MKHLFCRALILVGLGAGSAFAAKPNVVLVMCDDLGWGDTGYNGSEFIKTPHLDQMAGEGLQFNRFYAAAPVCSPTRGSCITGRHPFRYGITFANTGKMKAEEITLAEILKEEGYTTGHFGKWHLGTLTTQVKDANRGGPGSEKVFSPPQDNGFDVCFSTESKVPTYDPARVPKKFRAGGNRGKGWDSLGADDAFEHYGTHYWNEKGEEVTENLEGDNSKVIMDRAEPFIRVAVKQGKPFFSIVWFHTPHLPVVAGPKHRKPYEHYDVYRRNYYGCVTAMDEQVGRLRALLAELKVADDTLVFFCSDNGPEGKSSAPGSAGPFRGRKRSLYEGGVRVPGILVWPAKITSHRKTEIPCVTSDYFPTVLDILGYERKGKPRPYDGMSLLPLIEGKMTERPRPIGFQSQSMQTLSDNRFKLVVSGGKKRTSGKAELYDLLADPAEKENVAAQHPDRVMHMSKVLAEFVASCKTSAAGEDY